MAIYSEQREPTPPGRDVEEFVAPMPLDKCVRRLEQQHEPPAFWAWDWQYRVWIETQAVDALTYRFVMRKVQRSMFELRIAYASVRGYLRAVDGERTAVIAEARYAGLGMLLLAWASGLSFSAALAPSLGLTQVAERDAVLFVVLVTAIAGAILTLQWLWAAWQVRRLFGVLRDAVMPYE